MVMFKNGMSHEALMPFRQMLKTKAKPNEATVLLVLFACGQLGAPGTGRWVHSYTENNGVQFNVHDRTTLANKYSTCGNLEDVCHT